MKHGLTKSQASELLRAASVLPLTARDAFISAVDVRLCRLRQRVTDADVSVAITSALSTFDATTPSRRFMCDAVAQEVPMDDDVFDENGLLRDGARYRVPMMMRDGDSTPLQRAVAAAQARRADGVTLEDARRHVEEVYLDEKRKLQDAWRTTTTVRGQQPGDQCTINGAPGHLNEQLECIPDKREDSVPRVMTADAAQRIKDAAYNAMVRELENAWRK